MFQFARHCKRIVVYIGEELVSQVKHNRQAPELSINPPVRNPHSAPVKPSFTATPLLLKPISISESVQSIQGQQAQSGGKRLLAL